MDSHEGEACTRFRHHPFVPSQYKGGVPWVKGKKRYGLVVGRRRKSIHAQALLRNVLLG